MGFHKLETSPRYEHVIKFQKVQRTNHPAHTTSLQKYEGKPKHDDQIMAITAQKMSNLENERFQKYDSIKSRYGNMVATVNSEQQEQWKV